MMETVHVAKKIGGQYIMMRSLFSSISGLRNHQTKMDVIGNNIANVNTVGFKSSRVSFQDTLTQTLQGAAGASSSGKGGTNPIQIGLGASLASIDTVFTDGSFQPTGKQTDLAVQGTGFFCVTDGTSNYYTRAGSFDFDNTGNLLIPGTGYKVMGWPSNAAGEVDATKPISPIQVPAGQSMPAKTTSSITYKYNLSAGAAADATSSSTLTMATYDAQGIEHKVAGTFTKTGNNTWTFTPQTPTVTGDTVTGTPSTLVFDGTGKLDTASTTINAITITPAGGAPAYPITPDFSQLTQYGGETTVQAVEQDGYKAGALSQTSIDSSGVVVGLFSNGQSKNLAQIVLASFTNPSGLTKSGDSLFVESTNSGTAQIGKADSGGRGKVSAGTLEMSNVDLAQEFSNMIITQRGFQANSKIITATDEMLQELANLKR